LGSLPSQGLAVGIANSCSQAEPQIAARIKRVYRSVVFMMSGFRLTEELVECQREVVHLANKGPAQVRAVVASEKIRSAKLHHGLDRCYFVAYLGVENTVFGNHPVAKIRLPQECFLPPVVDIKAPVLPDLPVGQSDGELVLRCIES